MAQSEWLGCLSHCHTYYVTCAGTLHWTNMELPVHTDSGLWIRGDQSIDIYKVFNSFFILQSSKSTCFTRCAVSDVLAIVLESHS